jgi:glycosyltransferase involved in cell wall biosynthesis
MRILVAASYAPSLLVFRGPLLRRLVDRGHEVLACAPAAESATIARLGELGVAYSEIPLSRAGMSPVQDARTLFSLLKVMSQFRPDRVLAYTAKPVIYSAMASRIGFPTRVFAMITGLGYAFGAESGRQRSVGALVRRMYRVALKNCAGVFFQNPDDHQLFAREGLLPEGVPVTLINGSGVDLHYYAPVPLPDTPVFLLIARLLADKGIREYVAAARAIKATVPEARFQVAGWIDPNPMSIHREELAAWEDEGVIEYLGALDDVRPALRGARFYVLPSYREGTPRTVLEAMAMGRPIITADAPGCRETVIHGRNGFLVPVRDVEALRSAMKRFIEEPDLAPRMGAESLKIAREKYDVHTVNAVILEAMAL